MGQDAKDSKVIDCKTYNFAGRTGIAILTSNYHFYVANNVEEVRSRRYYDPPGTSTKEPWEPDYLHCFIQRWGPVSADLQKVYCLDAPPSSWVIMPHDRGSSLLVAIDNLLYLTEKGQCNRLAASFGKSFLTDMPPHAFVSMCRNLRVLNAVRDYMVGIPLTYGQYPLS
ncbi:Vacuolar protein sorting-associated protein 16 [Porites harrisoni]